MVDFGKCETITNETKIVLHENHSKITFLNNKKLNIRNILVDNCLITNGLRCDYLLILPDNKELFVELKGHNVQHAIKQIEQSIETISKNKAQNPKASFIISTRCPLASAEIQNYKKIFKKKFNCELIIKNSPYEQIIN